MIRRLSPDIVLLDLYLPDMSGMDILQEAVRLLERAVELKPSDPVINDHLGDAYWRVGRKLEATFQWNHARDMKPEPEELPKILDKIANGLPDEPKPAAAEAEKKATGG